MDDYINREDAFNIKNYLKRFGCFGDNGFVEIEGVLIALSKIPSADVAPIRQGRWKDEFKEDAEAFVKHRYVCTVCGEWQTYGKTQYCPNCGAKMEDE